MTLEETVFRRSSVDFSQLEPYGFTKKEARFVLEKSFLNGDFKAVVSIDGKGSVSGQVYDTDTGDVYLPLRVTGGAGGYAEQVRNAYKTILEDIKEKCFIPTLFAGAQANRIARKIFETYGDTPDFPWGEKDGGVFRNPDSNKWYGLIMNIDESKLNRELSGAVDVMNLKISTDKIPGLIKRNGIYPAYHMNKKYWISVTLNDALPDETVMELIAESHSFSCPKKKKH
ncbi:MAG: MmcQ/YjbR family DNA-binding protein [Alphaproteobacteria bacterium]|nr:MmcQ/YjbR family DNA-binding protein [Alphaproteobacteria bacterium]